MWSICIGPADEPDHYKRTFECPHCEHQKVVVVKYD
jgi:transcription elongation factor Elf1